MFFFSAGGSFLSERGFGQRGIFAGGGFGWRGVLSGGGGGVCPVPIDNNGGYTVYTKYLLYSGKHLIKYLYMRKTLVLNNAHWHVRKTMRSVCIKLTTKIPFFRIF